MFGLSDAPNHVSASISTRSDARHEREAQHQSEPPQFSLPVSAAATAQQSTGSRPSLTGMPQAHKPQGACEMLLYLESPDLPGQLPRSRGGRCQEAAEADTLSCVGEPSERSKCGPAGAPHKHSLSYKKRASPAPARRPPCSSPCTRLACAADCIWIITRVMDRSHSSLMTG